MHGCYRGAIFDELVVSGHVPAEPGPILSRFRHKDGSLSHALTNNSRNQSIDGRIRSRADGVHLHEVGWKGVSPSPARRPEEFHGDLDSWRGVGSVKVCDRIAPGQMLPWKIVRG